MLYSVNDQVVRRVAECLQGFGSKSLQEIVVQYNKIYPPSFIRKVVGSRVTEDKLLPALIILVREGLVYEQLLSFTTHVLEQPVKHYTLTSKGIQFLHRKR